MNGHETLEQELDSLGSELRKLPSLSFAVLRQVASSTDVLSQEASLARKEPPTEPTSERPAAIPNVRRRRVPALLTAGFAAAIGMVGLVTILLQETTAQAFEQVAERALATRTMQAVIVDDGPPAKLLVSGARLRFEGGGAVSVADAKTGEEILLRPKEKLAYRIPSAYQKRLPDFYGMIRAMAKSSTAPVEDYVDAVGRRFPGHRGEAALALADGEEWKVQASVWSDPQTKLPVRVEVRPAGGEGQDEKLVLDRIQFDVPLDERLFDTTVPEGYQIAGVAPDQLRAPPSAEEAKSLTIVPKQGIGDIRFGMTRAEIVPILGEPEFVQHSVYLGYPSKGLQLIVTGPGETLAMIIANPMDAASLTRHEFRGQTDAGVKIGSTEADVRQAYGEPDPPPADAKRPPGYLVYEELGLSFACIDGKVAQILASR